MSEKHLTEEELFLFVEDEIKREEYKRIKEHLRECKLCQRRLEKAKIIEESLSSPPLLEPPPTLLSNIMAKISKRKIKFEELFISLFIGFLGIFATLFYLVYTKGIDFVIQMILRKVNFSFFLKNGISNFSELISIIKKVFEIIVNAPINHLNHIIYFRILTFAFLTLVFIVISIWKKEIVFKRKK